MGCRSDHQIGMCVTVRIVVSQGGGGGYVPMCISALK